MEERPRSGFEQVAAGYWKKIKEKLPSHLTEQQMIWLENYLQVQVAMHLKDFSETRKILTRLDKEEGFIQFEESHPEYFATLEMIVREKTNRERVKILFTKEDLNL